MSTFNRMKISTALIAALMAGLVLHGGDAFARSGNGGSGNGAVARGAPADTAHQAMPVRCLACRFVNYGDKHHHGHDKHKKDRDGLACKGVAGCLPHPGGTTASAPPAPLPVPIGATGPTVPTGPTTAAPPMPVGPAVRDHRAGGNASHVTLTGPRHDTGILDGIGSTIKDVGGAIKDAGKAVIEAPFNFGGPTPGTPGTGAPKTSTTTQN